MECSHDAMYQTRFSMAFKGKAVPQYPRILQFLIAIHPAFYTKPTFSAYWQNYFSFFKQENTVPVQVVGVVSQSPDAYADK